MNQKPSDIRDILLWWGRSRAMSDAYHLDFPHKSPYSQDSRQSDQWSLKAVVLNDEHHALIDSAVSQLKTKGDNRWSAVVLSYVYRQLDREIGKHLGCSTTTARETRVAAENWLEAKLEEKGVENVFDPSYKGTVPNS